VRESFELEMNDCHFPVNSVG